MSARFVNVDRDTPSNSPFIEFLRYLKKGLLQVHLDAFDMVGARVVDTRREGYDKQYEYADALKGAYGIFFFQHPSMLEYQERLKRKNERCNAQTILGVNKIPSAS